MVGPRTREWVDAVLVLVALTTAGLAAARVDSSARLAISILAATFLPGAAVLTRFPVKEPLAWIGLAATLSFAVEALVGSCALWLHAWRPVPILIVLGTISTAIVADDLRRARRDSTAAAA